jgi:hypothetical protein
MGNSDQIKQRYQLALRRHCFSVLLQMKGVDLATVAGIPGHTTG